MLDDQRIKEINDMDMMQNTSIIHHPESLNEVQIIGLLFFSFVFAREEEDNNFIFYAFLIHHCFEYGLSIIRALEVKKRGVPDINGVLRGQLESILGTVELLASSGLFGYCL